MGQRRISLSIDESIYKLSKVGQGNMSKYVEQLMREALQKREASPIYEAIMSKLLHDPDMLTQLQAALPTTISYSYRDNHAHMPTTIQENIIIPDTQEY